MSILRTASLILAVAILTLTIDAFASAADAARNLGYSAAPGLPYGDLTPAPPHYSPVHRKPPVRVYKATKRAQRARR